jgi:hypothetical protein
MLQMGATEEEEKEEELHFVSLIYFCAYYTNK